MVDQEKAVIRYVDTTSKDYTRAFANSTVSSLGPYDDVVIDFNEEVFIPYKISERSLTDEDYVVFSHPPGEIVVEREKKFSVTMSKKQALQLAEWIFNFCKDEVIE